MLTPLISKGNRSARKSFLLVQVNIRKAEYGRYQERLQNAFKDLFAALELEEE
ncbi:MAG: hypothetical protein ACMUIM_09555 [bacterium]